MFVLFEDVCEFGGDWISFGEEMGGWGCCCGNWGLSRRKWQGGCGGLGVMRGWFSIGNEGDEMCFLVYESLNSFEGGLFYGNGCGFLWVLNLGIFLIRR